jgi:hypothetical protein
MIRVILVEAVVGTGAFGFEKRSQAYGLAAQGYCRKGTVYCGQYPIIYKGVVSAVLTSGV